jgi:DNA-binding response OmpR family regulator
MSERTSILIADDDREITSTLNEFLSGEEYSVKIANDGDEAISLLRSETFQIVILDLKMPKVDGFKILHLIKRVYKGTKVIVLTAYADLKNVTKCRELGADDVIEKPYEMGDLFDSIEFLKEK